jgi:molybdopterin/thiamine biosynthesis adenylyltransferase
MNIDISLAGSRPAGVAQELLGKPVSAEAIYSRHVVLTGEPAVLSTLNGRWAFVDSLRLLLCVAGRLTVVVPRGELAELVGVITASAWSRTPPVVVSNPSAVDVEDAAAVLNVGNEVRDPAAWTAINSNGWVVYASSQRSLTTATFGQANAAAALMAASFGVAEVFKRLIGTPGEVAPLLDSASLSLFDYSDGRATSGPHLPEELCLTDAVLVGAGAIGNGIALLLSQLPVRGKLRLLDKQDYGVENFGTCLMLQREGWMAPKAEKLATWLKGNSALEVTGRKIAIDEALASGFFPSSPALVLNALDDVSARRAVQDLWPRVLIDGGINSVGAAVIQYHLARHDCACLRCWFVEARGDHRVSQSRLTGLSLESLNDINRHITDEDISNAAPEYRESLARSKREGMTICSTIIAAEVESRLGVKVDESFRPSVPFVATAAASLVVAEAIKAIAFPSLRSPAMFQLGNLFLGPEASGAFYRAPSADCRCVVQRQLIEQLYLKPESA